MRYLVFLLAIIAMSGAYAFPAQLTDSGTGATYNGAPVENGDLTITIWTNGTSASSTYLVFNQTYDDVIDGGEWNVILNDSVLDLEFGRKYWKDYLIENVDIDFDGEERLPFYSTVGAIDVVNGGIAIGAASDPSAENSIAIGFNSTAAGPFSMALGDSSFVSGGNAVAIGQDANASGAASVSLGTLAGASGNAALAIGYNALASASAGALAIGANSIASGISSLALGNAANASAENSIALGNAARAFFDNSVALGADAETTSPNQFMVGSDGEPLHTVIHGSLNVTQFYIMTPGVTPGSPVEGMVYFNSALHLPCYYNSTAWLQFNGSTC